MMTTPVSQSKERPHLDDLVVDDGAPASDSKDDSTPRIGSASSSSPPGRISLSESKEEVEEVEAEEEDYHRLLCTAILELGLVHATPSTVQMGMQHYNPSSSSSSSSPLTIDRVKSHLQKYRKAWPINTKERAKFILDYDTYLGFLQVTANEEIRMIALGTILGGKAAAHATFCILQEEKEDANRSSGHSAKEEEHRTTTTGTTTISHKDSMLDHVFTTVITKDGYSAGRIPMPQFRSDAERTSALGVSLQYVHGALDYMTRYLLEERRAVGPRLQQHLQRLQRLSQQNHNSQSSQPQSQSQPHPSSLVATAIGAATGVATVFTANPRHPRSLPNETKQVPSLKRQPQRRQRRSCSYIPSSSSSSSSSSTSSSDTGRSDEEKIVSAGNKPVNLQREEHKQTGEKGVESALETITKLGQAIAARQQREQQVVATSSDVHVHPSNRAPKVVLEFEDSTAHLLSQLTTGTVAVAAHIPKSHPSKSSLSSWNRHHRLATHATTNSLMASSATTNDGTTLDESFLQLLHAGDEVNTIDRSIQRLLDGNTASATATATIGSSIGTTPLAKARQGSRRVDWSDPPTSTSMGTTRPAHIDSHTNNNNSNNVHDYDSFFDDSSIESDDDAEHLQQAVDLDNYMDAIIELNTAMTKKEIAFAPTNPAMATTALRTTLEDNQREAALQEESDDDDDDDYNDDNDNASSAWIATLRETMLGAEDQTGIPSGSSILNQYINGMASLPASLSSPLFPSQGYTVPLDSNVLPPLSLSATNTSSFLPEGASPTNYHRKRKRPLSPPAIDYPPEPPQQVSNDASELTFQEMMATLFPAAITTRNSSRSTAPPSVATSQEERKNPKQRMTATTSTLVSSGEGMEVRERLAREFSSEPSTTSSSTRQPSLGRLRTKSFSSVTTFSLIGGLAQDETTLLQPPALAMPVPETTKKNIHPFQEEKEDTHTTPDFGDLPIDFLQSVGLLKGTHP